VASTPFWEEAAYPFRVYAALNKQPIEKILDLREKSGEIPRRESPSYLQYIDASLVEEAKKQPE
jgi:hypothetical protein